MKLSPEKLSEEARVSASSLFAGEPLDLHEEKDLDTYAWGHLGVSSQPYESGKTGVIINRYAIAPEQSDLSLFEHSSESVELIYDEKGTLEAVRDIPAGYDAQWSMDRIADAILPKRREQKQARIAQRAEGLVRAARRLIEES